MRGHSITEIEPFAKSGVARSADEAVLVYRYLTDDGALSASFARRGFGYVIALSGVVLLAGAGGMYAFENHVPGGLNSYGAAVWWTAMLLTTIGSEYWPQTAEGRVLCFLLSLYSFGVFGYITAALVTS